MFDADCSKVLEKARRLSDFDDQEIVSPSS